MVTVMTIESEQKSAERLGYTTTIDFCDPRTNDVVIRWGNSELTGRTDFKRVVNPSKAIVLNCHKLNALHKLAQVVKTPTLYTKRAPAETLVLLRPIAHTNGEGFKVVKGPIDIDRGFYGTSWVKTKLEYRVWFAWNKTLCAERVKLRKYSGDDGQDYTTDVRIKPERYPCRSSWGYKFLENTPRALHRDVIKATKKIGLSLGAADVLVSDDEFIFLELNSAPTVDHKKIRVFFQSAINSFLESSEKRRKAKKHEFVKA